MSDTRNRIAGRVIDALPDTPDFRDKLYEATLVEVPPYKDLDEYRRLNIPILDQGSEGACTGFALATVANYLLRTSHVPRDTARVSPRMLYDMARRYDEWPGEDYSGSSARGAMKGWHKHGVCSDSRWPYKPGEDGQGGLTRERAADAAARPLGAYYRVNHKDLVCMHAALAEVGILYATAMVHSGWEKISPDGEIHRSSEIVGGHAFAIVAYDHAGFWIQNSWGHEWGNGGFCHITYDDWLANGTDVWVARLGAPVQFAPLDDSIARTNSRVAGRRQGYAFQDLRPHIISLGNDGQLRNSGTYATTEASLQTMFEDDLPALTEGWSRKRILLYAHGGLVDEASAVQYLANLRADLLRREIYPISFVWHSDFLSCLKDILAEAIRRRRPEGILGTISDFMLDRIDDTLEPVARSIGGKTEWEEMKENALLATTDSTGGARLAMKYLKAFVQESRDEAEIHLVGHSAGSIFHAPLLQYLTGRGPAGLGLPVASCTLWAPACTLELFKQYYLPVIKRGDLGRFALFTLTDRAEQDDNCAGLYHKSLLYLVSNAFEEPCRIPLVRDGYPLLGMEKFVRNDPDCQAIFKTKQAEWIVSPNTEPIGSGYASAATSHGGFDDDHATLHATLSRILAASAPPRPSAAQRLAARLLAESPLGVPSTGQAISAQTAALARPAPRRARSGHK